MQEQTMFVGDDPAILVDVIENGSHVAATINTTTTRVDGNSAVPTVTTIGTGNYKISFPSLTPAPAEGDELIVKVNGDIGGTAWTEAIYKLKVLPQIVTSMDGKLGTIESTADDIVQTLEDDIAQSIFNLPSATAIADAVWDESLTSHSSVSGSVCERLSKIVYVGQSFTYTKDSNPAHTQDVTIT